MNPAAARADVFFGLRAAVDVSAAMEWYELQQAGLGERFLRRLARCVERLRTNAESAPTVHGRIRRAIVSGFPYGVFYTIERRRLVILAVIHARRHPQRWPRGGEV